MFVHYPRWRGGGDYRRNRAFPLLAGVQRARVSQVLISPTRTPVDVVQSGEWVKDTVDGTSAYWLRLRPSHVMTSATIKEMRLCPYRPPIDAELLPRSGAMLAGVLPKILVGTWRGERLIWHDVWTLEAARIMKLVIGRTRGPNSAGPLSLWAFTQTDAYQMPIGDVANPARGTWLPTNGGMHIFGLSGNDFGLAGHIKTVPGPVVIEGEHLQGSEDDRLHFYWKWDGDDRWHKSGAATAFPITVEGLEGSGQILYTAAAIEDNARSALVPYVSKVQIPEGAWEDEGPAAGRRHPEIASPQRV